MISRKMLRLSIFVLFLTFMLPVYSQDVINNPTGNDFNIGLDIFSDIWQNTPEDVDMNTINRGVSVFGMYNYQFGQSNFSFAIGLGITSHNMYHNSDIRTDVVNNVTWFDPISDTIDFKKSKLNLTYLDVPFEFRLKTESKFRMAVGFKLGYLLHKHNKYKGKVGEFDDVIQKTTNVNYLEEFRYGPSFRIGYKWFNLMAYYQMSDIFKPGQGPDMYPISVGISLMPF